MKALKKIIVIIILLCIAYSEPSFAMSQEQAGQTLAEFAINFYNDYGEQTAYSYNLRGESYNGNTTSGQTDKSGNHMPQPFTNKYAFDCVGWISFAVHNSLGLGEDSFTFFGVPPLNDGVGYSNGFEEVLGNYSNPQTVIDEDELYSKAKPGDLFLKTNYTHILLYVGDGYVIDSIGGVPTLAYRKIQGTDYSICSVGRITKEAAEGLNEHNVTTILNSVTGAADDYGLYYGTTEGHYVGSYTFGQWLFSKFAGFFDWLAGIITYIFRMQFLGWGNIIEELINHTINDVSGVKTETVKNDEENLQLNSNEGSTQTENKDRLYTPTATNTMWSNDRINIEDIIYNRVPFLDVNFLDVKLDRYKKIEEANREKAQEGEEIQVISEDSIVYTLRANIAKWYIVIRQICIIVLLLLLIYLGIRLAISTVASDKAKYKGMLVAWLTCFIVVFCIHYFMMIVIDINEVFVDIFADIAQDAIDDSYNGTGSKSIYDTMRTRAYSIKLSEGFPATIFYLVLIYFLIRFLFIYLKRYFTIMILALMGPIMSLKNCFDKISTGKSKSMSKWMYDFALNVFLQTIHAILYCLFMVIAFDLATNSVAGFLMSLVVLNFIFKAEKIFMKIFNFEGRASSLRDVNENKNYFAEAYKIGMGVTMFGGTALKYGFGAVTGSGRFLGEKALSGAQFGVSAFNRLQWGIRNVGAKITGNDSIDYKPANLKEGLDNFVENRKNGLADGLNNFIYNKTGKRSTRLDLHNIKKRDPDLYNQTKQALKLKKELKWKTLKRTFGEGTKSVRYLGELMMGVPMLVVDTQSGISTLMDATSGLKGMSERDKGYGYRRQIKGRRGDILNSATFGTANAVSNSIKKTAKETKKIKENKLLYKEMAKANDLEIKIEKEVDNMIKDGKKDEVGNIMEEALNEVMTARKIKEAVSRYMAMQGIRNVTESDLNSIVDKINSEIYGKTVDRIINRYINKTSKDKLDANDIDKIIQIIDEKIEKEILDKGVASIINDKSNKQTEHKEVKNNVNRFMKDEGIKDIDADKVKELLMSEDAKLSFGIKTTKDIKDVLAKKFSGKKPKVLDKKQAVSAIEDAILVGTKDNETNLGKTLRELKTLNEKTKNNYSKRVVDIGQFTKGMKEKLK